MTEPITPADELLREWFLWWWDSPESPTKMPNALQVRTGLHLQQRYPDLLNLDEVINADHDLPVE